MGGHDLTAGQPPQPPRARTETVGEGDAGQRVDNYLLRHLKGVPRTRIYRILRRGEVRVNGSRVKPSNRLAEGDLVRIPPVRVAARDAGPVAVPGLESNILHEDDLLIVLNKPAGLAVHGGSGIRAGVIEGLRALRPKAELELVHRLDRETSGCLLVAKRRSFLRRVHALLRDQRGMHKEYVAVVAGRWPDVDMVDRPLSTWVRGGGERRGRVDHESGKPSRTRFSVERVGAGMTLVRAEPVTGRTHQIRVHAASEGCPVIGDLKYGDDARNARAREEFGVRRMLLHAERVTVNEPETGYTLEVHAPLDESMRSVINRL